MKKFMAIVLAVFAFAALGCGGAGGEGNAGNGDKKLVVGLDDNFPPMGFKDEKNEIVGFDVDMAKEAAKRLNREVEFKAIDWASKEAELKSGRVDVLWNGLDITEERKKNMLFSDPYMDNRQIVFVKKDSGINIASVDDLAGKIVATQSGSSSETYLDGEGASLRDSFAEFRKYSDFITAFMDLENGRLDAVVVDDIVGRYAMSKQPNVFDALDITVGPETSFGIGFRKEDTVLKNDVQKVLDEMKKDGTTAKISEKWFSKDLTK